MESSVRRHDENQISTFDVITPKVGMVYSWLLVRLGYKYLSDLRGLSIKDLESLPGIGTVKSNIIMKAIISYGGGEVQVSEKERENVVYVDFRQLDLFR